VLMVLNLRVCYQRISSLQANLAASFSTEYCLFQLHDFTNNSFVINCILSLCDFFLLYCDVTLRDGLFASSTDKVVLPSQACAGIWKSVSMLKETKSKRHSYLFSIFQFQMQFSTKRLR
jgi:hypothetical protein